MESDMSSLFEVNDEIDEMAQYMRHDCLEISCVKSNANFSSESIVVNIGKALDLDINVNDISIAHPREALPKIIVKFTLRDVRNALHGFYITEHIQFNRRNDLDFNMIDGLKSCRIEIPKQKQTSIVTGCLYRHHSQIQLNRVHLYDALK